MSQSRQNPASGLEPYIEGPPWRAQVEQVYRARRIALGNELNSATPDLHPEINQQLARLESTREPVSKLGDVMRSDHVHFIPVLKSILTQDRDSVPLSMRTLLGETMSWRAAALPPSLEKDPGMAQSLKTMFDHARLHFSSGTEGLGSSAAAAADRYMGALGRRTATAYKHVTAPAAQIAASGPAAVNWCETLAGFTRQEVGPVLAIARATLADVNARLTKVDPAAQAVVAAAQHHTTEGVYRNIVGSGDNVRNAASRYRNRQAPAGPAPRPGFKP